MWENVKGIFKFPREKTKENVMFINLRMRRNRFIKFFAKDGFIRNPIVQRSRHRT